jgi:RNA recognition motif-containing protein
LEKHKLAPDDDPRNYDYPTGYGSAFIEFTSTTEAKRARRNIHLLKYNNRTVECEYHDEIKFELNDFSRVKPIKMEQRGQEFEGLENCAIEFTEPRQAEPMKI